MKKVKWSKKKNSNHDDGDGNSNVIWNKEIYTTRWTTTWINRNSNCVCSSFRCNKRHLIYVKKNSLDICNLVKFRGIGIAASTPSPHHYHQFRAYKVRWTNSEAHDMLLNRIYFYKIQGIVYIVIWVCICGAHTLIGRRQNS